MNDNTGMSVIVKTVTRATVGLILLYGVYIVLHGHLTPGGGFGGGVIIALSFIHIMLAFGRDMALKRLSIAGARIVECFGVIMFVTIALLGIAGGYFFFHVYGTGEPHTLFSAFMILLSNIAIGCNVGAGLFLVLIVIVLTRVTKEQ